MRPETMEDNIKKTEHRAYVRGYKAGRKRAKIERKADQVQKEKQAFLDKAFLAALPVCMVLENWTFGNVLIKNKEDRVRLAWNFAQEALKQRGHA